MKIPCPHCGVPVMFALPTDVITEKIVKEPCRCGMTEAYRSWRSGLFLCVALICALCSSCWISNYYATKQIEIMKDRYQIDKVRSFWVDQPAHFEVSPKQEEPTQK